MSSAAPFGYPYWTADDPHTREYLWKPVLRLIERSLGGRKEGARVLDLGSGNGAFVAHLSSRGYDVIGVEPSESGISLAKQAHPHLSFVQASADQLPFLSAFDIVTCLEVIEHCFLPRPVARSIHSLLAPGGTALLSTPYHGYWKNLAIALLGRTDAHYDPLWDYGHVKFWSARTLVALLREAGFDSVKIERVGRIPPFAKSMIAVARKGPAGEAALAGGE